MKTIKVAAGIICDSIVNKHKILTTARGYGEFKGLWEFPGGKLEDGESSQQALVREIKEELNVKVKVGNLLDTIEYDYTEFHLTMDCFWCEIIEGNLNLVEAEDGKWLSKEELHSVEWLPADVGILDQVKLGLN